MYAKEGKEEKGVSLFSVAINGDSFKELKKLTPVMNGKPV